MLPKRSVAPKTKDAPTIKAPNRRRQWGTEKRTTPLSTVHAIPADRKITNSRIAIVLTVLFWLVYVVTTIMRQFIDGDGQGFRFTMEAIGYLVVVTFLSFSALMYLVARAGAFYRFSTHRRVPRAILDAHFAQHHSEITVLVPSYAEEPHVIRATLLSAALQEYPSMRVVLLLDDPPNPTDPAKLARLEESRQMAGDIMDLLAEPRVRFADALSKCEKQGASAFGSGIRIQRELAHHYEWAAQWLYAWAEREEISDHVDVFFAEQVLIGLGDEFRETGEALEAATEEGASLPFERILELHNRLAWTFACEVTFFERKKYISCSHEANKAMNLNSYIALMGGSYKKQQTPGGVVLTPTTSDEPDLLHVPNTEFLLTLDADSILLRDYCIRLVYLLQQPENARVAVTQTPYSSFRGAGTRIERLAGATTDIQHILHQGMSQAGATFWVGANAVIRKRAIEDIVEVETVGGFEVRRYIQDRTVIEDTESSIDLGLHGWTLVNYPERLSYSATPPDFGSLIVQRRRWANGGLLIMPKLVRQLRDRRRRREPIGVSEVLLRVNYMASIAWASLGLVFLLAYPYDGRLLSPLVVLAAAPYFIAMANDLRYCGYRRSDVFRIYGFNLILLPVNLAGVLTSLRQALSNKKIPFARTPKIKDRTVAPAIYVITPLIIVGFAIFTLWRDFNAQNYGNAAFAALNASLALWAIITYIGIGHTFADIWIGLTQRLYVDRKPRKSRMTAAETQQTEVRDWQSILHFGSADAMTPGTPISIAVPAITEPERSNSNGAELPVDELAGSL